MRILQDETCAVLIDIQEKLFPVMSNKEAVLTKTKQLIAGLKALQVPLLATEQYSKGLGHTLTELKAEPNYCIEKTSFSCIDSNTFVSKLTWLNKDLVIVFGIEAHVCVLQTVIDLIDLGKTPIVVVDCISSRSELDLKFALKRMEKEGAILSTCESILLELCRKSGTETFKIISQIIK